LSEGDEARHGRAADVPLRNPTPMRDSRILISRVLKWWLEYRSSRASPWSAGLRRARRPSTRASRAISPTSSSRSIRSSASHRASARAYSRPNHRGAIGVGPLEQVEQFPATSPEATERESSSFEEG
jgi:hypothetical protein